MSRSAFFSSLLLACCLSASACELLVKAVDYVHPDPTEDARGAWKAGMIVVVKADGHMWGKLEALPPAQGGKFVVLKFPGVSAAKLEKYLAAQVSGEDTVRRRLWQIQIGDIPLAARNRLNTTGTLTVSESGGDYTWEQFRGLIKNLETAETVKDSL